MYLSVVVVKYADFLLTDHHQSFSLTTAIQTGIKPTTFGSEDEILQPLRHYRHLELYESRRCKLWFITCPLCAALMRMCKCSHRCTCGCACPFILKNPRQWDTAGFPPPHLSLIFPWTEQPFVRLLFPTKKARNDKTRAQAKNASSSCPSFRWAAPSLPSLEFDLSSFVILSLCSCMTCF